MTHRDGFPRLSASTRVARRCGTSEATRPVSKPWAARKPWETAVPVARANRQRANGRASESLADVPHRLRLPSYPPVGPTHRLHDLYGSLSALLGIRPHPGAVVGPFERSQVSDLGLMIILADIVARSARVFPVCSELISGKSSAGGLI